MLVIASFIEPLIFIGVSKEVKSFLTIKNTKNTVNT